MDAGVRIPDVCNMPVDASRESSMLAEALQTGPGRDRRSPQVSAQAPAAAVEPVARSQSGAESEPLQHPLPPGEFVSVEYAWDCARFIAESKSRMRHRAEAGLALP
jgi:hypothetical protein